MLFALSKATAMLDAELGRVTDVLERFRTSKETTRLFAAKEKTPVEELKARYAAGLAAAGTTAQYRRPVEAEEPHETHAEPAEGLKEFALQGVQEVLRVLWGMCVWEGKVERKVRDNVGLAPGPLSVHSTSPRSRTGTALGWLTSRAGRCGTQTARSDW